MRNLIETTKKLVKIVVFNLYCFFVAIYIIAFNVKYLLFLTPYHGNLGDHAIASAEKQLLSELGIKAFEVYTKAFDYCGRFFSKMIPKNVTILVHGGGFLGSLWKHEERRVRKVFDYFPLNRTIVFPQTITFSLNSEEEIKFYEESKKNYTAHKNLTIFVREDNSYDFMKKEMPGVDVRRAPDIVTRLKYGSEKRLKRDGVVFCFRKDHEKSITDNVRLQVDNLVKERYSGERVLFTDTVVGYNVNYRRRDKEISSKLKQFEEAKLVITDRLHGMIMAAITNTPCIAFGNSNGKVKGVYNWIKNNEYVKYVDTIEEFRDVLGGLNIEKQYCFYLDENMFAELVQVIGETVKSRALW